MIYLSIQKKTNTNGTCLLTDWMMCIETQDGQLISICLSLPTVAVLLAAIAGCVPD